MNVDILYNAENSKSSKVEKSDSEDILAGDAASIFIHVTVSVSQLAGQVAFKTTIVD